MIVKIQLLCFSCADSKLTETTAGAFLKFFIVEPTQSEQIHRHVHVALPTATHSTDVTSQQARRRPITAELLNISPIK